jgi:Putative Flp pilus-assembly TadE/G-like
MATERGYVLVATTVFATVLLAFLGLASDVGYLQWQKMRAQTAADAAAAGAGLQLLEGGGDANIVSEGQTDAGLNGFANGAASTTVTVNHPPLHGSQTGNKNAVEVIVQRTLPTYFMSVIGSPGATVTARAVTVLGNSGASGCVDTMNPSGSKAFQVTGSVTVDFYCGIQVASSSASAMFVGGTSIVYDNKSVGAVGGVTLAGKGEILNYLGQPVTPQKISAPIDPLSYVTAPSTAGLPVESMAAVTYDQSNIPLGNTIQPGIYCGGLRVGNTGGATFTMAPGVYYIAGGGFTFNSQAVITGTGVTIYNTSGPLSGVPGCNSAFTPFSINGQATVTLSAPTNGPLEGMLFFQDRRINSSLANTINGGANTVLNGAIYLLHSPLQFAGNNAGSQYLIIDTDTLTITGNSTVNADYSSLQDGSPILNAAVLAE